MGMVWLQQKAKPWWANAKKTIYKEKIYDSKFEAGHAMYLDSLKAQGKIRSWVRQVAFPLVVNGVKIAEYWADYVVVTSDGRKQVHETKGFRTQIFNMKWKLMDALYSDEYDLILIQQSPWRKYRPSARKNSFTINVE
jgi:hypothetical protein